MTTQPEPLVIAEPELITPVGQRFWTDGATFPLDKDGLPKPRFAVQEASKFFFGNGPDWLRWRMRADPEHGRPNGCFILDNEPMKFSTTKAGAHYFTLADIEKMAHALAQNNHIDGAQLVNIIILIKTEAKIHGIGLGGSKPESASE